MKTKKKTKLSKPCRLKFTGGGMFTVVYKSGLEKMYMVKDGQTIENARLGAQNKIHTEQDVHFADGGVCYGMQKQKFIVDEAEFDHPVLKAGKRRSNAATRAVILEKTTSAFTAALLSVAMLEEQMQAVHRLGGINIDSIAAHIGQAQGVRSLLTQFNETGDHEQLRKALEDLGRLSDRVCHLWIACNPWMCS